MIGDGLKQPAFYAIYRIELTAIAVVVEGEGVGWGGLPSDRIVVVEAQS